MGVMSRRVLPVCSNIFFFSPSLRPSSRQPVKRYKKFLADIFPRYQEAEPNDRKIGRLCDYVSKNPLRVPKITEMLEQRFYKELRHGNFGSVKVVVCIYRKFLSSCKGQMPLFSGSLLGIIRKLLDQTRNDEMQILACSILVDFIDCQTDGTHMFNLESLIQKLCQLARDVGEGERTLCLHSAGLEALASMVSFMGKKSHIPLEFDNIISVTLENYIDFQKTVGNSNIDEVPKSEDTESSFPDISKHGSMPTLTDGPELDPSMDISRNPSYWSRVCLRNMARLATEASTIRHVIEPLLHNFDVNNHWHLEKGLAYPVLIYLQSLLEEAGENSHLLLSTLVKHLDNKNVASQPLVQTDIVNITMQLGQNAKQEATVAITGAIFDLIKHLRKCLQNSDELCNNGDCADDKKANLQLALEKCIFQLSNKVGDVGPILDKMAVVLENIPATAIAARATISAVHRTAKIVSSIPNVSHHKKAFPDALFHQLLIIMTHPDHKTRVGAHNILAAVLMPSLLSLRSGQSNKTSEPVSPVLGTTHKTKSQSFCFQNYGKDKDKDEDGGSWVDENPVLGMDAQQCREGDLKCATADGKTQTSLRLSSHQISLLLSSIWVQATSTENTPANFEAMACTYNIVLLFIRYKTSNLMALVPGFQLAFSLRSISLEEERGLQPSLRRSLFTMASYMLIFTAKAGNLPELISLVKACLTEKTADPYLRSVKDVRLESVDVRFNGGNTSYGSEEDDAAASKSLSVVELNDKHLREVVISQLILKFAKISEDELASMKQQLLQEFSPDDAYPLGTSLFMETPKPGSPLAQIEFQAFEEIIPEVSLTDDETFTEVNGSQSNRRTSLSANPLDILSVNDLLESVPETARQVASSQISSTPVPYDQMMSQCEALVTGKRQKMSLLHGFKHQNNARIFPSEVEKGTSEFNENVLEFKNSHNKLQEPDQLALSLVQYRQSSFILPPSSPYDKFLKAAGY